MEKVQIKTDFIKLDQLLKYVGACSSGTDAKYFITEGKVKVNNEVELRRGRKLRTGDIISINNSSYEVCYMERNK